MSKRLIKTQGHKITYLNIGDPVPTQKEDDKFYDENLLYKIKRIYFISFNISFYYNFFSFFIANFYCI